MFKKLTEGIIYSELIVSLSGAFLCGFAVSKIKNSVNFELMLFVGLGIFFFYTLERKITLSEDKNSFFAEKYGWYRKNSQLLNFLLLCALLILLYLATNYKFKTSSLLILISVTLFFIWYSICPKIFPQIFAALRFRFFSKTILLVFSWVLFTIVFPLSAINKAEDTGHLPIIVYAFSWLLVNAIIFDLRDVLLDCKKNIRTVPVVFGRFFTTLLISTFNWIIIFTFLARRPEITLQNYAMILPNFIYAVILFYLLLYRRGHSYGFYLIVDFVLALPFISSQISG